MSIDNENLNSLSDNLFSLMMDFNKKLLRHEELIKSLPIPPSHVKVIFYLSHNGPSSVSNIAKDLCISKPNMTPIIDRLIEEGYVTRYEDPNDRRVLIIKVTDKSKECFQLKKKITRDVFNKKLVQLSDTDIQKLGEVTTELRALLSKLEN